MFATLQETRRAGIGYAPDSFEPAFFNVKPYFHDQY